MYFFLQEIFLAKIHSKISLVTAYLIKKILLRMS